MFEVVMVMEQTPLGFWEGLCTVMSSSSSDHSSVMLLVSSITPESWSLDVALSFSSARSETRQPTLSNRLHSCSSWQDRNNSLQTAEGVVFKVPD